MSEQAEKEMRKMMLHLYAGKYPSASTKNDFEGRELIVTKFDGAYGNAGHVVAMNGSPPRGVIVSLEGGHKCYPPAIFYLTQDTSRRVGEAQAEIVRSFLETI